MRTAIFKNIFLAAMSVFLVGMVCTVGAIYRYFASQQTAALETEARGLLDDERVGSKELPAYEKL